MLVIILTGVFVLYNQERFDNDTMIIIQGSQSQYPRLDLDQYMQGIMQHHQPQLEVVAPVDAGMHTFHAL